VTVDSRKYEVNARQSSRKNYRSGTGLKYGIKHIRSREIQKNLIRTRFSDENFNKFQTSENKRDTNFTEVDQIDSKYQIKEGI
jgi:hypothetical protein